MHPKLTLKERSDLVSSINPTSHSSTPHLPTFISRNPAKRCTFKDYEKNLFHSPKYLKLLNSRNANLKSYDNLHIENPKSILKDLPQILNPSKSAKHVKILAQHSEITPREDYSNYKVETMEIFKKAQFRIKRAREYIRIAKQITIRYT